ncbi:MAG: hypothetical protein H6833_05995 [Planctomycetes bacterium]|nr:hypothetical protein [Planctomycetota bacterium]
MNQDEKIRELVRRDPRYTRQAYLFLFEALNHTVDRLGRSGKSDDERHVSGRELLEGVRACAVDQFGALARTVLAQWGVRRTEDVGDLVFNLVDAELLFRRENDTQDEFENGYDFRDAFDRAYEVKLPEDVP